MKVLSFSLFKRKQNNRVDEVVHDLCGIANLKSIGDMIHAMNLRTRIEAIMATVIDELVIFDNVR